MCALASNCNEEGEYQSDLVHRVENVCGVQTVAHRNAKQYLISILNTQDETCRIYNIVSNIEYFKYLGELSPRIIGLFFKTNLFAVILYISCHFRSLPLFPHTYFLYFFLHLPLRLSLSLSLSLSRAS